MVVMTLSGLLLTAEVSFKIKYPPVCSYLKSLEFFRMTLEIMAGTSQGWYTLQWSHLFVSFGATKHEMNV